MMRKNGSVSLCAALLCVFLLGVRDGHIALWRWEDPEPIRVFPYKASLLPEEDQRALARGIRIDDEEELRRILLDYLS